ncbi:MAG: ATPase domain-containing protein [Candidatus Micrarchaeia archaeon]
MARKGIDFDRIRFAVGTALSEKGETIFLPGSRERAAAEKARLSLDLAKTGIPGLDVVLGGGVPRGSTVLVSGGVGAGKSILCLQALVKGALKYGEPGLYVTFEESPESIRETALSFGWPVDELEKKKLLRIAFKDPYEIKDFSKTLSGEIYYTLKDMRVKRVAIDSITYLGSSIESSHEVRKTVATLDRRLKENDVTSFLVSEVPAGSPGVGRYGVEEFVVDGVVMLHNFLVRDVRMRAVEVLKLKHAQHDTLLRPFKITAEGIEVFAEEQVFK